MSHCAEFQIIGRIGQIKKVGTTLRVTIASGETHYGVTLACEQIGRLAKGPGHAAGADESP